MTFFRNLNLLALGLCLTCLFVYSNITQETVASLDKTLEDAKKASSDARKRLAVRRAIRNAEELINANENKPERFLVLAFLFRAQQTLITLDDDSKHRAALLETCRTLMKAPKDFAHLAFEADILLSQAELARKGAGNEERAAALRPIIQRYVESSEGAKVLRVSMVMAIELGDVALIADIREMMAKRYAADHAMIKFQREKLGGQVLGAPLTGTFKRSDGKTARLPMDLLGRAHMVAFWSKDNGGLEFIKGLAAASKEAADEQKGRMGFISINLDDLPDAGEAIIRGLGVDWPVLHLPGGRKHPVYLAYTQEDPKMMNLTPTGQTALVMSGVGRVRTKEDGSPDFHRYFGSALARGWSQQEYMMQVAAMMAGDFLIFDPTNVNKAVPGIDPTRPPELKAAAMGKEITPLPRTPKSVPESVLSEIQGEIVTPPLRYSLTYPEAMANYAKLQDLCNSAIAEHPNAPDLWIVRNRLIVAKLGLWKMTGALEYFEEAASEAQAAIDTGYPKGCDVIARFCLARAALREAGDKSGELIDAYVADQGGEIASGPVLASALLLALDVADRMRVESLRARILTKHTEYSGMWAFSATLLNRHHTYWMFQVPFTAGWSYGRRQSYYMGRGGMEPAERMLKGELQTADGKALRIPEDLEKEWTLITFSPPIPWSSKRDDGLPLSPLGILRGLVGFADSRPEKDVDVILATFGGDSKAITEALGSDRYPVSCKVVTVPGEINNPIVQRLGFLSVESKLNTLLVRKDGRIARVLSSLESRNGSALISTIRKEDETRVVTLAKAGKHEEALKTVLALIPHYDPEAVDERGRKLRKPNYTVNQLRARARVYLELGKLDKALADAQQVYLATFSQSGGMSMRTEELDEAEALRAEIQKRIEEEK